MDDQGSAVTNYALNTIEADRLLRFITSKKHRFVRHSIVVVTMLLFFWKGKIRGEFSGVYDHLEWIFTVLVILSVLYINMYVLLPWTVYKGRLLKYSLALTVCVSLFTGIAFTVNYFFFSKYIITPVITESIIILKTIILFFILLPLGMASTALKFFQKWLADTGRMYELEKRAMESELQALRNQIQPHFLFNMLNSIKVLISREPEKAIHITMKLSDFLRHLLYGANQKDISADSEIRFLNDYLSLEKMRRDDFEYTMDYSEQQLKGVKVPPNVLLILVENAVKHSADPSDGSYIDVKTEVKNGILFFHVTNSLPEITTGRNNEGGVGLINIERRLSLMYGEKYYLNSSNNGLEYIATLKLPL